MFTFVHVLEGCGTSVCGGFSRGDHRSRSPRSSRLALSDLLDQDVPSLSGHRDSMTEEGSIESRTFPTIEA